ncbi:MAG: tRNA (adenosine(37)-N6)-dimethylallyltransferase MiaA [Candidatus Doudnabacteria bacterium]|nr:tRNA (adenosine(37)-N6)-dimethylallyltransferase MiaA [Candidatus Doudnabacteria bacterium]
MSKINILAVIGPTASGKSELAVKLAKQFDGEIISADSRQIYKNLNIGTGKVEGRWERLSKAKNLSTVFIYKNIPHYAIDIANPQTVYSVSKYKTLVQKIILEIFNRGKLPILCGGTAQYIDTVVYNQDIPQVKPNWILRKKLAKYSTQELSEQLKELDPERAKTIDQKNPVRLIRALEIIHTTGKPVPNLNIKNQKSNLYNAFWIGIETDQAELYKKIEKRLKARLKDGMIEEVKNLHSPSKTKARLSWKRLESFGLEYKYISLYLQNKLTYEEMETQLFTAIKQYSKRQMTWWKRNPKINWLPVDSKKINVSVAKFLKK